MRATGVQKTRDPNQAADNLAAAMEQAEALLKTGLDPEAPLRIRLSQLRDRLAQERLQVAVLGQFKRGKSSFINALLGAPLLPSAVVPLTAAATFIAWGETPRVRISFAADKPPEECRAETSEALRDFLFRYVAEEANPQNRLGVAKAELFYPAPILSGGTVLIDTPGVGSTLKHNTEAALRVIPECDSALFVVATDPPITETELDYLDGLKSKLSRIFFILNKIDTVAPEERESLAAFLRKVLSERSLLADDQDIFQLSARQGLAAKTAHDAAALAASGVADIEQRLLQYLEREKTDALKRAIALKTTALLNQASTEIELRLRALTMPLDRLEETTAAFQRALDRITEQRRTAADLLAGEKRRLIESLEARIAELRDMTRMRLAAAIAESLSGDDPVIWQETAREAISSTLQGIFDQARQDFARDCARDADAMLAAYRTRTDELVAAVRRSAAELFDVAFREDISDDSYAIGEEPYWVTEDIDATLIPDVGKLVDSLLPLSAKRRRLRERLLRSTDQLIVRNAENLRWALLRGLEETFRAAAGHLEERLDDAVAATQTVIVRALSDQRDQSFAVQPEIAKLETAKQSLAGLSETVGGLC
jgi:GTP-binding protein EngB required for normal cell division